MPVRGNDSLVLSPESEGARVLVVQAFASNRHSSYLRFSERISDIDASFPQYKVRQGNITGSMDGFKIVEFAFGTLCVDIGQINDYA